MQWPHPHAVRDRRRLSAAILAEKSLKGARTRFAIGGVHLMIALKITKRFARLVAKDAVDLEVSALGVIEFNNRC